MPRIKKSWSHARYGKDWIGTYAYVPEKSGTYQRVFLIQKEKRDTKQYGSPTQAQNAGWKLNK